jgi:hypothetical protein
VVFQAGVAHLAVKDSIFSGNTYGIEIQTGVGRGYAAIERTRFEGNYVGLLVREHSSVTVRDSVAAGNRADGFLALSTSPDPSPELNIESCVASNNGGAGIRAIVIGAGATVRVSNSTVTGNDIGLSSGGVGTVLSRGNNTVEGNSFANFNGVIGSYGGK